MTARVFVIYHTPADPQAFDRYYASTHVPIAKRLPGLRGYEVSRGPLGRIAGGERCHLVAVLTFDSTAAIEAALASPQGQATAADLANFATGGVDIVYADVRDA